MRKIDSPPSSPLTLTCPCSYNANVIQKEGSSAVASPYMTESPFFPLRRSVRNAELPPSRPTMLRRFLGRLEGVLCI